MPEFKYQNIRLDDGTFTRPADEEHMGENPRFLSAMRMLDTVFGPDKTGAAHRRSGLPRGWLCGRVRA